MYLTSYLGGKKNFLLVKLYQNFKKMNKNSAPQGENWKFKAFHVLKLSCKFKLSYTRECIYNRSFQNFQGFENLC